MFHAAEPSIIAWFVLVLGGFGLPIGVPPLPEDPMMAKVAPQECLFYMSSSGVATPDGKSANQTEQLLAEPEVRQLTAEVEKAVKAGLERALKMQNAPQGPSAEEIVNLAKVPLGRPLAFYISSLEMSPNGPVPHGGLIVGVGDDVAKAQTVLDDLVKRLLPPMIETVEIGGQKWQSISPKPGMKIVWGFKDKYFLLGVGEGEIEAMLKRENADPPAWLTKLRKELPVDRVSTVVYVDCKVLTQIVAMSGEHKANIVIHALGLGNVTSLASVAGLDAKAFVSKSLLSIDGKSEGIFQLADIKPLTADDLAIVPEDATFAAAFKVDPEQLFKVFQEIVGKVEPRARAEMDRGIGEMEEAFKLRVRDEILKPLGDTWRIFDSPSEGGAFTGITLVASLKDPQQALAAQNKLVLLIQTAMAREMLESAKNSGPNARRFPRNSPKLNRVEFAGKAIFVLEPGMFGPPVDLTWCVTDKELVVALYPQAVKAYLSRTGEFKSLAQTPEVAQAFQNGAGPIKLLYGNSRRMFDIFYPALPFLAQRGLPELRRELGVELNTSILPSARSIRPHLMPTVIEARRTPAGIEVIERRTMPGASISTALPMSAAIMMPTIPAQRESARRVASINQMKNIVLAMHNYAQANRSGFPPAYSADKNGKPLLSWRVLILPFIEEEMLFREFHLDEPWDSEHNKKLIPRMPASYRDPSSAVAGQWKTNYLTVRGKNTIFTGDKPVTFGQIRDGTSNTIMTVEVSDEKAVIWSKPDDFEYDETNPMKGLVGLRSGGFIAGFADGSVQFLRSSIDAETLKLLFMRDDGKPVDSSLWER